MPDKQPNAAGGGSVLGFIGAIFGALICFIGAAASASALGRPHKVSTAVLAILAAAFAVGAIVLARVAILCEHRLRSNVPAHPVHVDHPAARHPKNGPATRIFVIVLLLAVVAFLVVVSISQHSKSARSSETQHHGLSRTGTVVSVHSVHHTTRYDSWDTYNYDVALSAPVDATTHTVVHDPTKNDTDFSTGDTLTALVNPKDPGYAELPGRPAESSAWFVGPLLIGGPFVLVGILLGYEEVRHRRRRTAAGAGTPAPQVST
jgi:hypothetical protein